MHLPTITAVAIACLGHDALVSANSGYYQTCNSVMLTQPQHNLIGNCKKTSGIYNVNNAIKLNSCFGNSNGNLVAQLKLVILHFRQQNNAYAS